MYYKATLTTKFQSGTHYQTLLFKPVQGLARETPTAKPVAFIGILARHTHKFIFAIGSKPFEDYKKKTNVCDVHQ